MPRVPTARTTTGRIPFASQAQPEQTVAIGQSVANVFRQGAQVAAEFEARDREAKRKQFEAEGLAELTDVVSDLRSAAESDPKITGVTERFEEAAADALNGIADRFDEDTAAAIRNRGVQFIASTRASVASTERQRFSTAAAVSMSNLTDNYILAAASAPNELAREQAEAQFLSAISQSDFLAPRNKDILVDRFRSGVSKLVEQGESDSVTEFVEQAIANPSIATPLLADASALLSPKVTPHISAKDRLMLRRSIKTAGDAAEQRMRQAERDATNDAASGFLDRIHSEDPDEFPSVGDVLNSPMGQIEKEHFIGIIEQHNKGQDTSKGVPAVEAALLARIHDSNSSEPITRVEQLMPWLGRGLGTEKFGTFLAVLERKAAPATKQREQQFSDFITRSKAQMVSPSFIFNSDPIGMKNYNDFSIVARNMWIDGLAAGKTPEQLLLSDSPDYIGKIIPQFQKGLEEKSRGAAEILFTKDPEEPEATTGAILRLVPEESEATTSAILRLVPEESEATTSAIPRLGPDELTEQYLERIRHSRE